MRVLYFHQHFSTPQGSTGTRSYEMSRRLVAKGHNVTVVCGSYGGGKTGLAEKFRDGQRTGVVDDIEIIEFDLGYSNKDSFLKRFFTFLKFAFASVRVALTRKYDVVFATSTPLTAGIPGIFAKLLRRKKFVFEVRDLWPELPREMGVITNPIVLRLMSWLEWSSYHVADRCVGLSPGIVEGICSRGIKRNRVAMIPNGCDLGLFNQGVSGRNDNWRPDGVADTDLMLVFAGTHGIANGLDAILDGAKVLANKGREDIKFVFVGEGMLKPSLAERARREGLINCIFLDPIPKIQLSDLFGAADMGIMALANVPAFYYGTSPNKFFDYIASGLPVLNNYPGWLADMIAEYDCGVAVPPDDPLVLANRLIEIANNRAILDKMGKNGLRLAKEKFDRNDLAESFVAFVTGEDH